MKYAQSRYTKKFPKKQNILVGGQMKNDEAMILRDSLLYDIHSLDQPKESLGSFYSILDSYQSKQVNS